MAAPGLLNEPLPPRRSATELGNRLIRYICEHRPERGTRLATEAELIAMSNLSRSTIRRALRPLQKEGWIIRRAGVGTLVGPKVSELDQPPTSLQPGSEAGSGQSTDQPSSPRDMLRVRRGRGVIRVAVLIYNIGDLAHDWYTPQILAGIDDASESTGITLELLGDRDGDLDAIGRRLERSRPDALICLSNRPRDAFVIRDAQRMGIKCVVSGTPHLDLQLPVIVEDNLQLVHLAVDHLVEQGHRRIAFAIEAVIEPWVMLRHRAFIERCAHHQIDGSLSFWMPQQPLEGINSNQTENLLSFLKRESPTAALMASEGPLRHLAELMNTRRVSVPEDLSLVIVGQHPKDTSICGVDMTRVQIPFFQMGQKLAELCQSLVMDRPADPVPPIPASLHIGQSVRRM